MQFLYSAFFRAIHNEETTALARVTQNILLVTDQQTPIDFDHQATTPCDPEVLVAMKPYWHEFWGNASSRQSRAGLHASAAVNLAREQLACCLEINPERLIFTSGATEANNLALLDPTS